MAQVTFILKEPNSQKDTLVYLIFRFQSQKLKYSTGIKVLQKSWNPERQRLKVNRLNPGAESINLIFDQLEQSVGEVYRRCILDKSIPTAELLRKALNQMLNKEPAKSKDLAEFARLILETSNKKEVTKKGIRQTIRNLNEFKSETGYSIDFDAITLEFYDAYINYLQGKDYGLNTIGAHIKNIKAFMREAFERGLTKNISFQSRRFRKLSEESQSIYLTMKDLNKLEELKIIPGSRLDKVRDLFLFGCYTGLRFSDLTQLRNSNFDLKRNLLRIKTQKTSDTVVIPLNKIIRKILDKYDGHPPPSMSNVKMNLYLKELAEIAKLIDNIEVNSTKGGLARKEVLRKCELVTVHTARRSFATNAFLQNVPTISIMKITGHRTEKSFLTYIKISQEENAQKLNTHPFFK